MFPTMSESRESLSEIDSDFSQHGYKVIGSIPWPSSVKVPKISNIVSEGFDKCETPMMGLELATPRLQTECSCH